MKDISIKGLVVAVIVAVSIDIAWSVALLLYIGGINATQAVETYLQNSAYLALSLALGLLTTILGGYIVGRMAKSKKLFNALLFGCIGIAFNAFTAGAAPLWFDFLNFALLIPAALFGATLAVAKVSPSNA